MHKVNGVIVDMLRDNYLHKKNCFWLVALRVFFALLSVPLLF